MHMDYGLRLEISQKLSMTPQLCQAIAILQLSSLQLAEKVEEAWLENPILELDDKKPAETDTAEHSTENERTDVALSDQYFDWLDDGSGYDQQRTAKADSDYLSPIGFAATGPTSLHEHLEMQLHLSTENDKARKVGEYFIGCIDDSGYLRCTVEEAAEAVGIEIPCAEQILALLQTFDPAGVAARDLKECLLLQLRRHEIHEPLLEEIIDGYLDEVANGRIRYIADKLDCTPHEVQAAVDMIRMLTPKPGQAFGGDRNLGYVLPDVTIERVQNEFVVTVNDSDVPRLTINPYYRRVVRDNADGEARKFVEGRINAAVWLIKSIEQRRMTLYNVTNMIVKLQDEFFRNGPKNLRPMTMKKVADSLGIHESTVSRTVANKYATTPFGLFPLRHFFSAGITGVDGECMASSRIKQELRDTITAEDPAKPFSDQILAEMLAKRGMELSRRTVAKYREEMGIASSGKRKRY
ncbi:MAG: rpoN [Firmicutes bacterium]|nr:rpoN [Bacillota bacterium]